MWGASEPVSVRPSTREGCAQMAWGEEDNPRKIPNDKAFLHPLPFRLAVKAMVLGLPKVLY